MKAISRSRQLRLSRRKQRLTEPIAAGDNDEFDVEHDIFETTSITRSNQNANRIPTVLFDTISSLVIEEKHPQIFHATSDQSSLFLHSINSQDKSTTISADLTSLTKTTTDTTPLTDLTFSNRKQTDITTVKTDLAQLSRTHTSWDSSSINLDHAQSLSLERKISLSNISHRNHDANDLTQIHDMDTSIRSVVFSKDNLSTQEHSYPKCLSYFTLPHSRNEECVEATVSSSVIRDILLPSTFTRNVNIRQMPLVREIPSRWNPVYMTTPLKIIISFSLLSLIIGIAVLIILF